MQLSIQNKRGALMPKFDVCASLCMCASVFPNESGGWTDGSSLELLYWHKCWYMMMADVQVVEMKPKFALHFTAKHNDFSFSCRGISLSQRSLTSYTGVSSSVDLDWMFIRQFTGGEYPPKRKKNITCPVRMKCFSRCFSWAFFRFCSSG